MFQIGGMHSPSIRSNMAYRWPVPNVCSPEMQYKKTLKLKIKLKPTMREKNEINVLDFKNSRGSRWAQETHGCRPKWTHLHFIGMMQLLCVTVESCILKMEIWNIFQNLRFSSHSLALAHTHSKRRDEKSLCRIDKICASQLNLRLNIFREQEWMQLMHCFSLNMSLDPLLNYDKTVTHKRADIYALQRTSERDQTSICFTLLTTNKRFKIKRLKFSLKHSHSTQRTRER